MIRPPELRRRSFRDHHAVRSCIAQCVDEFGLFLAAIRHGEMFGAVFHHMLALGNRERRAWRRTRKIIRRLAAKEGK
jgi:hypothetical protein